MVEASIIIPTYNRTESLNDCINSILGSGVNNIEVIIVNDYKEGDVVLNAQNRSSIINIVNNPKKGVASARNYGATIASAPNLIFVDDDMILNKNAITSAIYFLNTTVKSTYNADWIYEKKLLDKISGTQFGRYLIHYKFTSLRGWNGEMVNWKENSLIKAEGITSQFFAIKRSDFNEINGYDENFPYAGFEDYELYNKFKKYHITNYIDTRVLIYHNEIDRVVPESWLNRQQRGAKTRKVAVTIGFNELEIKYTSLKRISYFLLVFFKPLLLSGLKLIPNNKYFDKFYFKFINLMQGINIYQGYTKH